MIKNRLAVKYIMIFIMSWSMVIVSGLSSYNILSFLFLCLSFTLVNYTETVVFKNSKKQRIDKGICFVSVLLSILYASVAGEQWSDSFDNKLFKIGIIMIALIGLCGVFYYAINLLFYAIDHYGALVKTKFFDIENIPSEDLKRVNLNRAINNIFINHTVWCTVIVCMIAWLPYFLYLFPGIMTPDSLNQLEQAIGIIPYSNHHPWIHTLFIKFTFSIGQRIGGSPNMGIALYTLSQMIICAFSAGYAIDTLKRMKMVKGYLFFTLLFFALVPFNAVFVVTMWKDILFGYGVMVFSCTIIRIMLLKEKVRSDYVIMVITGLIMCLFRSNGWYGFILTSILFVIYILKSKKYKEILPILLGTIIIAGLVRGPVMDIFKVTHPDFVESLSVPLQQVARVLVDGKELEPNDRELINKVIDTQYINQLYEETFADNVKELVRAGNPWYLEEHKLDYLKLYIKLGVKYPNVYLAAYRGQVGGYWFPDTKHEIANVEGIPSNNCGVYPSPIIGGKLIVKIKEIWIKLGGMVPLYGAFWCTGSVIWMLILSIAYIIKKRKFSCLFAFVPSVATIATVLIATPVSGDFRYVYYAVLLIPILFGVVLLHTIIQS